MHHGLVRCFRRLLEYCFIVLLTTKMIVIMFWYSLLYIAEDPRRSFTISFTSKCNLLRNS